MGTAAIAVASLVATVVGGAVAAKGASDAAAASAGQARYQAQVAKNNQIIATNKGLDALERGEIAAQNEQVASRQRQALIIAGAAARGVEVGSGSSASLLDDEAAESKRTELVIRSDADRERIAFINQAQGFEAEAGLRLSAADNSEQAGRTKVASTLINTGASVAPKYNAFKKQGAFD